MQNWDITLHRDAALVMFDDVGARFQPRERGQYRIFLPPQQSLIGLSFTTEGIKKTKSMPEGIRSCQEPHPRFSRRQSKLPSLQTYSGVSPRIVSLIAYMPWVSGGRGVVGDPKVLVI